MIGWRVLFALVIWMAGAGVIVAMMAARQYVAMMIAIPALTMAVNAIMPDPDDIAALSRDGPD